MQNDTRLPGVAETVAPGVRRLLAPNPSPMTERGTNTYLVGDGAVCVIDPGPDLPAHLDAILAAPGPGGRVAQIVVTHAHRDHSALAPRLAAATGAPVLAYGDARAGRGPVDPALPAGGEGVDEGFRPDRCLADGEALATAAGPLVALWTPGHFGNHLCLALGGVLFTGDLVMGWASTLISPPDGNLAAYRASLSRLAGLGARCALPGHGAAIADPAARIAELLAHRAAREQAVRAALAALGPATPEALAARIYTDTPAPLMVAAARNVLAHLLDLEARALARRLPPAPGTALPRWSPP